MEFQDYDRISDTLLYFDNNTVLEFVVNLSSKDRAGNRLFFHTEVDYDSNKYYGVDKGHSIKRRMTFYFAINDRRAFDRSFIIRPEDAMMLDMLIKSQILPWYFDSKRKIFSFIDNELKIVGQYQDVVFARNEYSYLRLQPCIYKFDNGTFKEGIRMYVSSQEVFVDMEIDKFLGFYYFITNTDMYAAAASLVTYAKCPPYEINKYSMGLTGGSLKAIDSPDVFRADIEQQQSSTRYNSAMNDFFNRTNKPKPKESKKKKEDQ